MILQDKFLFDVYCDFINLKCPELDDQEAIDLRIALLTSRSFLEYKLEDRRTVLRYRLKDKIIDSFLLYLYNREIDDMSTLNMKLCYKGKMGSPLTTLNNIAKDLDTYEHPTNDHIKAFTERVLIAHKIGYEDYFFNLHDDLLIHYATIKKLSFERFVYLYGKNVDNIVEPNNYDLETNLVKMSLLNIYTSAFNSDSLKYKRIFLKTLSSNIVLQEDLKYPGMYSCGTIYLKPSYLSNSQVCKSLILHESCHILSNYEKRYDDFKNVYMKQGFEERNVFNSWNYGKERAIDFTMLHHCNDKSIVNTYQSDSNNIGRTIDNALIELRRSTPKEGFIWM